jgi:hypothetical protein
MPLTSPNLDDRDFRTLLKEAVDVIDASCPNWTDRSPSDPGMILLEVFAYLTDVMIYRLNRIPEKAYVEFLRLIGVNIEPPSAAMVKLQFRSATTRNHPVLIPEGTRVTVSRVTSGKEPPIFVTSKDAKIEPGKTDTEVCAYQCEWVEGECAGCGTGLPGQSVQARRPPIIARTGDDTDLMVGVEARKDELREHVFSREIHGKSFRKWREVENFTNLGEDRSAYIVDRVTGVITFAPAVRLAAGPDGHIADRSEALADVPPKDREIRLWYRRGGGPEGNVAAHTLTVIKDPIAGVEVTNPGPATGGRAAETYENALLRGPTELRLLHRVVTAEDYEHMAVRASGAIARAKAFTKAGIWEHAKPGTVEVLIVPQLPEELREQGLITRQVLEDHQREEIRTRIQEELNERCPLGTTCVVGWARYQTVRVKARVVIHREEDRDLLKKRVEDGLCRMINPLPSPPTHPGWRFGRTLHVSHVYDVALSKPGVSRVEDVSLLVDDSPREDVQALAADEHQSHLWYAGGGDTLFRTLNNGDGWNAARQYPGEKVKIISANKKKAGLIAVATVLTSAGDDIKSRIYLSWDCGETWEEEPLQLGFTVADMDWVQRDDGVPVLLFATDVGLYQVALGGAERFPIKLSVDPQKADLGLWAVAVAEDVRGWVSVAVAARDLEGVYLSYWETGPLKFEHIGLRQRDVRVLRVQEERPRCYLWAGASAIGEGNEGEGCFMAEILGPESDSPARLEPCGKNWHGGSCHDIGFMGSKVLAVTHADGVVWLEKRSTEESWKPAKADLDINCGLPRRGVERYFHPLTGIAVQTVTTRMKGEEQAQQLLMVSGAKGVFRSRDGVKFKDCSVREFDQKVTLPENWLFCSGQHEIEVVKEHETSRD